MGDPNKIRLFPIDPNSIVLAGDNDIELEPDPFRPPGWKPPPGVTPIGGNDVKATLTDLDPRAR